MLTDANGEERKGIEVVYPRHFFPSDVPEWVIERIVEYHSQGFHTRERYSKTVRDLMLAGF